MRINHTTGKAKEDKWPDMRYLYQVGEQQIHYLGIDINGHYLYKADDGKREIFLIIDPTIKDVYDTCLADASKQARSNKSG